MIYESGRRKKQVIARDLYCFWAVQELGISRTELALILSMIQPAAGYAVSRNEKIAKRHKLRLDK